MDSEGVKMNHLKFSSADMNFSQWAIITGNPFRLDMMAQKLLKQGREIFWDREFRCWSGYFHDTPLILASHGIGGPSTSILVEELAMLGIRKLIRMGTSGSIQEHVNLGDLVVTMASVRLDGTSQHYAPIEYPAVADPEISLALQHSATKVGLTSHLGITASSDTFYPGQERYDSYGGYVRRNFQGSMTEWKQLRVLNYEMESSALLTQAQVLGLKAGCVTVIVAKRIIGEEIVDSSSDLAETHCIQTISHYLEHHSKMDQSVKK
jgi:uridine phosphorylase